MREVLGPRTGEDWEVRAGGVEWTCRETAAYIGHDLAAYVGQLAGGADEGYLPFDLWVRASASPGEVLRVVDACGAMFGAVLEAVGPAGRGWHWGVCDAEGFAAMGVGEVLPHTYDIACGLGVAGWLPPAGLCAGVLGRLFPDAPDGEPARVLLWCTGRREWDGRARRTSSAWKVVLPEGGWGGCGWVGERFPRGLRRVQMDGRGLFDGFGAYRTPTRADFAGVLTRGLVVPDANVLLNLYRYTERARDDLMGVLGALGDRLWVPHQVVEEFWRNRETVIGDAGLIGERAVEELGRQGEDAVRTLRVWAGRVALGDAESLRLQEELADAFARVRARVGEAAAEGERRRAAYDTGADPVVAGLEGVLAGRVGAGFGGGEAGELRGIGRARLAGRVPPGYMDAEKEGDGALGDFFVWEQIVRAAAEGGSDVLFVTADAKEDWWRKENGVNRGPRPELVAELLERGGGRLFMLSPKHFLEEAAAVLGVSLHTGSVADVARVERTAEGPSYGGWNAAAVDALFRGLAAGGHGDLADVLRFAAEGDGWIAAAEVCDLCGYEDERGLRGFLRPLLRVGADLVRRGLVPDSAVRVLGADRDKGGSAGFRIHPLLVPLVRDRAGNDG